MSKIGEYIREVREEKGMSVSELSRESEVSQPYLSQIEYGSRNPSPDILRKLSKCLGVSYISLMFKAGYLTDDDRDGEIERLTEIKKLRLENEKLKEKLNKIKELANRV